MYATSETESISAIEGLFAGDFPVETLPATLASGAGVIADFSVLGKVTATGKYILCDTGASDGSETPAAIAVYGGDATAADVAIQIYVAGSFNMDKLVWDASFATEADKLGAFTDGPLFVKKTGPAV